MATIQFKKGDEYLAKISKLELVAREKVCGAAIYGAADIMIEEVREQLKKVPTDESWGTEEHPTKGPKKVQKVGLSESLGIASMQDDGNGFLNVKIGFDGYNQIKTERWPKGQPNQLVARSIERGTSYMKANSFVKKAVAASKKRALDYMKKTVDEETEKIMKG